jgi:hypothetical protein
MGCHTWYHFAREAIAANLVSFHHIPGELIPVDILSKHWAHSQLWTTLQPLIFWSGETGKLLDGTNMGYDEESAQATSTEGDGGKATHLGSTKGEL